MQNITGIVCNQMVFTSLKDVSEDNPVRFTISNRRIKEVTN
ncbi:hypothetical protein QGN23_00765 [Chryseobacterium gotjawalense]|uniref:Uncharacterized protein n=1 Tax=Chryseobacterium gotjawalense TaxID=3042315 RepID=A0ABY8RCW0_9FLAO|nr:hypothetical protein [Chryseobacterium sp. wdc7]WHF51825.1 hypothetical protein QGN23_00765 [Chryseobacterium sp. wdc7]